MYFLNLSLVTYLVICGVFVAVAAAEDTAGSDSLGFSEQVLNNAKDTYFTVAVENDLFGGDSDRYYTSGIRISWFELHENNEWVNGVVDKVFPFFPVNDSILTTYSIGQNIYTPADIEAEEQDLDDRPWAAFLYGSISVTSLVNKELDEIEMTIGVIGPSAYGEEVQRRVHEAIGSPDPQGWENQLENELGLNLSWQRRWLAALMAENETFYLGLSPHAGFAIGNVYTYANIGGIVKLSSSANKWNDRPLLVRPGMPGTGFFIPPDKFTVDAFIGLDVRYMAHNIFLDGNTFEDSHSVEKEPFVADLSYGVALSTRRCRLSYTLVHRTKEFVSQEHSSVFGSIGITINY